MNLKLGDDFMRHFRWITPLLLLMLNIIVALLLFIGKGFMDDFIDMKKDVQNLGVHVARIEGHLDRYERTDDRRGP